MVAVGERYALRRAVLADEQLVEVEIQQLDPAVEGSSPSSATVVVAVPNPLAAVVGRCVRVTLNELALVPEPFPENGISLGEVIATDLELEMASAHIPFTSLATGPLLQSILPWSGPSVMPGRAGITPAQASNVEPLQLVMTQMAVRHAQQREKFA